MTAVRLRASVVCVRNNLVLLVHLKDPVSGLVRLFPPGGAIENGETPVQAAVRETLEETGVSVDVDPKSEQVAQYRFFWANRWVDCTTHFFGAVADSNPPAPFRLDPVQIGVSWEPIEKIPEILSFDVTIAQAVLKLLPR